MNPRDGTINREPQGLNQSLGLINIMTCYLRQLFLDFKAYHHVVIVINKSTQSFDG